NISVNGVPVATFEIEDQAGEVFFDAKDGVVELRDVSIDELPTAIRAGAALKAAGFEMPRPVKEVKPSYTSGAIQRKVHGTVLMELVVLPDGSVRGVSVIRSLDPELDRQAIVAGRQWRFTPGLFNQRPVPVVVTLELTFTLGR
ncbi:MAG TPA: energy transducer TonB, partial [Vicinamibacterales bacterium]